MGRRGDAARERTVTAMSPGHFRRRVPRAGAGADEPVAIDVTGLGQTFAAPGWLRDAGLTSWLLVGITLLVVGAVWVASLTETIVNPVITAAVVAAVAAPLVRWLAGHRVPRGLGAALVLLGLVGIGAGMFVVVIVGITSQTGDITHHLSEAKNTMEGWLKDIGVNSSTAADVKQDASTSTTDAAHALLHGLGAGIKALSGLAFFLALTALSLFFLLKDGPMIREWGERHLGVPVPVAHTISHRVLQSLRGYFFGVTIVAGFNAIVVSLGALVLGVPLVGTLAAVTFIGAYIPYLGAWSAGAFSVLIALGGAGADAAAGMIVVQLLANGILQQLVQPIAYGAALGIHPLAVLIVTIAGGALFGAVGLILAAPVTSAITRISADLGRARADREEPGAGGPAPAAAPP
jgi:predicted PurR-regulated permease PerM